MENNNNNMVLYGFSGNYESIFFGTEKELIEYAKTNNRDLSKSCVAEYIGEFAKAKDVIKVTYRNLHALYFSVKDEKHYGIYNEFCPNYRGKINWQLQFGNLKGLYRAFRDRGVKFENDFYIEDEKQADKFKALCKKPKIKIGN